MLTLLINRTILYVGVDANIVVVIILGVIGPFLIEPQVITFSHV